MSQSFQVLGDFELIRELGRGGMGIVYEARQVSLNRKVALKVLKAGLGLTTQAVNRFRREAAAAAKLHHTNIVPVYATGEDGNYHFYAMEPGLYKAAELLPLGFTDKAREEIRQLKDEFSFYFRFRNGWYEYLFSYCAGELEADALIQRAGKSLLNLCEGHFAVALMSLSQEPRAKAAKPKPSVTSRNVLEPGFSIGWNTATPEVSSNAWKPIQTGRHGYVPRPGPWNLDMPLYGIMMLNADVARGWWDEQLSGVVPVCRSVS